MNYKCRCTKRTKKWIEIPADSPEEAAEAYAEFCRLEYPDEVTVMNQGNYQIYITTDYLAKAIKPNG